MAEGVSLREVADEFEISMEGLHMFLHCQTGEIIGGTDESVAAAEGTDDDGLPEWQRAVVARLREALGSADWLELPTRRGAADYRIMERFCVEACTDEVQDEMLEAIRGRGAFGRFRDEVQQRGLKEAWHRFRRQAIEEEAEAWLQEQAIMYHK